MELTPVRCIEDNYESYVRLFSECFPGVKKYNRNYLEWLYRANPDGEVVGFDAWDGERLAAHYACVPARAEVSGLDVRVLLSLNTATSPQYQGRGLFTKLAEATYAKAISLGYDCVYGVANANSTPGFTRKLNFQLVGPLRAAIGIGSLAIDFSKTETINFKRLWSQKALTWRCACPANDIAVFKKTDRILCLAPALAGGTVAAYAEMDILNCNPQNENHFSPIRLFIGTVPSKMKGSSIYFDIPNRFRPSPLNFIYRSLSGRVASLNSDSVFLNFLDFDAY